MDVLIVDPSVVRGARLQGVLESRGLPTSCTNDAFYALSMSERARFDALFLSAHHVAGFDLLLHTFLVDPAHSHTKLHVFDHGQTSRPLPDRVALCAKTDEEQLASWMVTQLGEEFVSKSDRQPESWDLLRRGGITLIGTFEVTSFADLLQLVCASEEAGTVQIRALHGDAKIQLRGGRVERVTYATWRDIEATARLLRDIEQVPSTQFKRTWDCEEVAAPLSIPASTLLLEASVFLDQCAHSTANGETSPERPAARQRRHRSAGAGKRCRRTTA